MCDSPWAPLQNAVLGLPFWFQRNPLELSTGTCLVIYANVPKRHDNVSRPAKSRGQLKVPPQATRRVVGNLLEASGACGQLRRTTAAAGVLAKWPLTNTSAFH